MRRFTLFFGWLVVVGLATTLTWQIVSAADDRVSERPIAPLNVAAPVITDASTTTSTTVPSTPTTSMPALSTSTSSTGTTAGRSTTSTSPPTTAAVVWQTRTVNTAGGTLTLRYRPGEVTYQSATPAPGYKVEVEKPGPPEVKVEFESESQKVDVEASWEDRGLDVHIATEDEGEHGE